MNQLRRGIPVILIGVVLVVLNVGLETVLSPAATPTAPVATPDLEGLLIHEDFLDAARVGQDWALFSGEWTVEDGALVQHTISGSDFGAGYRAAALPENYHLRVRFAHQDGVGGGVLFAMSQPDSTAGAVLVRYAEQVSDLMWGAFDETGHYIGVGSMNVPPAGTGAHTLEITCQATRYTLRLDGEIEVSGIPVAGCAGYLGLTTTQSVVAFDLVQVFTLEPQP